MGDVKIDIGSCTYVIDELIETIKKLGVPCNDNCNLPFPANTYGFEEEFKLPDNFTLPAMVETFLMMGKSIHAKAKLILDEKEQLLVWVQAKERCILSKSKRKEAVFCLSLDEGKLSFI